MTTSRGPQSTAEVHPLVLAVLVAAISGGLVWATLLRADDAFDQRRTAIERMEPADKEHLRRNYQWFLSLNPQQQERLRKLHQQIEQQPNREELQQLLDRYCRWLKTLTPRQVAELKDLPAEERIKEIKAYLQEPVPPGGERDAWRLRFAGGFRRFRPLPDLPSEDEREIVGWIEEIAPRYLGRFLDSLPESYRRQWRELEQTNEPSARRDFLGQMWLRWQSENPGKLPQLSETELEDLYSRLSPATKTKLEGMSPEHRRTTITRWIRVLVVQQYLVRRPKPPSGMVGEEELSRFLEKEVERNPRDPLLSLSGEELERQLLYRYLQSKMQGDELPTLEWGRQRPGPGFGPGRRSSWPGPAGGRPGDQSPHGLRGSGSGGGDQPSPPHGPPDAPHRPNRPDDDRPPR